MRVGQTCLTPRINQGSDLNHVLRGTLKNAEHEKMLLKLLLKLYLQFLTQRPKCTAHQVLREHWWTEIQCIAFSNLVRTLSLNPKFLKPKSPIWGVKTSHISLFGLFLTWCINWWDLHLSQFKPFTVNLSVGNQWRIKSILVWPR